MEIDPAYIAPFPVSAAKERTEPGEGRGFSLYFAFKLSLPVGQKGPRRRAGPLVTERAVD